VPVKFVGTEIAPSCRKKVRFFNLRNLQVKAVAIDAGILEQLKEAFGEQLHPPDGDMGAAQRLVRQKMQVPAQGLVQRRLDRKKMAAK